MNYPNKVENMKPGVDVARMLIFTREVLSEFTPREIITYIEEGFIPVERYISNGFFAYRFIDWINNISDGGNFVLALVSDWVAESPDLDTKFNVYED